VQPFPDLELVAQGADEYVADRTPGVIGAIILHLRRPIE